jgi:hypothetical protein
MEMNHTESSESCVFASFAHVNSVMTRYKRPKTAIF